MKLGWGGTIRLESIPFYADARELGQRGAGTGVLIDQHQSQPNPVQRKGRAFLMLTINVLLEISLKTYLNLYYL